MLSQNPSLSTSPLTPRRCSDRIFSPLRQNHCQYVNYCLRSFPCLCANSLAVRLLARTSPLLLCVNFSQLRFRRVQASLTGVRPLTWEYCSPSFPSGLLPHSERVQSYIMEVLLPPSCGFPQKPFPPAGPHGFRGHLTRLTLCVAIAIPSVRRDAIGAERSNRWTFGSGIRASEDGASTAPPCYAACNAPATRSDGALPTHSRPALGTHTVAADFQEAASRL